MNSPTQLDYETRPLKFTERRMLLSSLLKICYKNSGEYQYIGFGGLSFTDYKLFHKKLHINNMHSIEGGRAFSLDKLKFNSPYNFIKIYRKFSTEALNEIDLSCKSLVWLDYDGALEPYMFEDISILMNNLPIGSIYIFTCNRELKKERVPFTVSEFESKFSGLHPFDLVQADLIPENTYKTIRKMLIRRIEESLYERALINDEALKFIQLYNILYQENRGAQMYTFGGVISDMNSNIDSFELGNFDFIKEGENAYTIKVPNITYKEKALINDSIGDDQKIEELKQRGIVSESEIKEYIETYKYSPNFFDIFL